MSKALDSIRDLKNKFRQHYPYFSMVEVQEFSLLETELARLEKLDEEKQIRRYIVRYVDANGKVQEKLLTPKAFKIWEKNWKNKDLQVIEITFDDAFSLDDLMKSITCDL